MNIRETSNFSQASKCRNLEKISLDMDYSLLATHIQKSLTISGSGADVEEKQFGLACGSKESSFAHVDSKRTKIRGCAYLEDIEVYKCPLCPASYSAKDLLTRHALRIHHKAVVALLQEGSTEQHLKCRFCVHKVMQRHQKLLLLHLEKKHATEFLSFFKQSCIPSGKSCDVSKLAKSDSSNSLQKGVEDICLFDKDNSLTKQGPFFDHCFPNCQTGQALMTVSTDTNSAQQIFNHSYAKRKLVLDDTSDCHPYMVQSMKENIPPIESLQATLADSGWKHATGRHFACGRCKEAFSCNALLLDHVGVRHRGPLRLLQPLFTCGLCSASFYKNSFLVRHCYRHHTPH